jgi:ribonuclease HI
MEYLDERDLNVYTDGSAYPKPRHGGVGILFVTVDEDGHERVEDYPRPGYAGATNQQMELAACLEALKAIVTRRAPVAAAQFRRIVIWTDSMYLVSGYDSARFDWQVNGWMTRDGNPVANAAMWKELLKTAFRTGRRVEIKWVKGHKRSRHNKAADKLAKRSARHQTGRHLSVVKVRRKKSDRSVEPGSVEMRGQRITIRIITDEYLPVQRANRYKYEVVSRASEFYGFVDTIYSRAEIHLSAGHTYHVRLNDETARPRVGKMFREIIPIQGGPSVD